MEKKNVVGAVVQELDEHIAKEDCMNTGGVCDCANLALCERLRQNCKAQLGGIASKAV